MANSSDDLQNLRIDRSAPPPAGHGRWLALVLAVVVVILAAGAWRLLRPQPIAVRVAVAAPPATAGLDPVALTATGYIVAHHTIYVNSKVTGKIAWIGVEKGDHVHQGQVLVRLQNQEFRAQVLEAQGGYDNARAYWLELKHGSLPEQIAQALHTLDQARATLVDDQLTLRRTQALAAAGIDAKQTLDDARATDRAQQQDVAALQQAYILMKIGSRPEEIARAYGSMLEAKGQLDYAQAELAATEIRAPVTGTILDRTAEVGELVTAEFASTATGGPVGSVVTLANLNDLQVQLDIAEADFGRLTPGMKALLWTDTYPDRKYQGYLAQVSPEADQEKATIQVKVQVRHPDAYLRPEMNATVQFLSPPQAAGTAPAGVAVPTSAVRRAGDQNFVLLAFQGRALRRNVQILGSSGAATLVTGLNGGEQVITQSPAGLHTGDRVRIQTSGE
ncbi:MAG: efflux RND transporter periplasmic adaptor subunit [Terriglobales bacterium]